MEIQDRLLHSLEVPLASLRAVLPRNHLLGHKALELFFADGSSLYLDFASSDDRKQFFEKLRVLVPPSLQKSESRLSLLSGASSSAA